MAWTAETGTINVVQPAPGHALNVVLGSFERSFQPTPTTTRGISQTRTEVSRLWAFRWTTMSPWICGRLVELWTPLTAWTSTSLWNDYDDPEQDLHIHFKKGPRHSPASSPGGGPLAAEQRGTGYATADIGRQSGTSRHFSRQWPSTLFQVSNLDKIPEMRKSSPTRVETDLSWPNSSGSGSRPCPWQRKHWPSTPCRTAAGY